VVDREEERDGIDGVIRVKVREEDAVDGERVEVSPEHPAHRPRAQVEDQCLTAGAHHDTALSSL
jgi:hypothetical protein